MYKTIEGLYGMKATVIADSISKVGVRLLSLEIEYPRIILAEQNTHRQWSRNSASSRAIPFAKMVEQLIARPVRFGQANAGMQDKGEGFDGKITVPKTKKKLSPEEAWEAARASAIEWSGAFYEAGYHKQVYNRITEPFQMIKSVVTFTEGENYFWLRLDADADPTICELARIVKEAADDSKPTLLQDGDWHLPYVDAFQEDIGQEGDTVWGPMHYYIGNIGEPDFQRLTLEEAIEVSVARCAAVSYRNEGYGLEKCREIYARLVGSEKKHASALEHVATPIADPQYHYPQKNVLGLPDTWEKGISHMDRQGRLWSGNFRGFIQYRKTVPGENYTGDV